MLGQISKQVKTLGGIEDTISSKIFLLFSLNSMKKWNKA